MGFFSQRHGTFARDGRRNEHHSREVASATFSRIRIRQASDGQGNRDSWQVIPHLTSMESYPNSPARLPGRSRPTDSSPRWRIAEQPTQPRSRGAEPIPRVRLGLAQQRIPSPNSPRQRQLKSTSLCRVRSGSDDAWRKLRRLRPTLASLSPIASRSGKSA